jgi:hypothetical protein
MVLCTEIACTKEFQPAKKLSDMVDGKKFGELYTEISTNYYCKAKLLQRQQWKAVSPPIFSSEAGHS